MGTAAPVKPADKYQVARPQGKCMQCGRDIAPDEKFMAALRETPQGFERLDLCHDCWAPYDKRDILGFWQTTMPRPEEKKKLFVDDEVLRSLFERLQDATEAGKLNFRFVLGLILMRKRMLIYENTRMEADHREIWLVRLRGQDQTMDLLNPRLTEEQVGEVSQQLSEILNEEL